MKQSWGINEGDSNFLYNLYSKKKRDNEIYISLSRYLHS